MSVGKPCLIQVLQFYSGLNLRIAKSPAQGISVLVLKRGIERLCMEFNVEQA
jgi:hypothetical protein